MTPPPWPAVGDEPAHGPGDWRSDAEARHGPLRPNPSPTLTASEIGSFAFCPQAWYLQRCRTPVTREAEQRRQAGTRAHRAIGRRTDLVRTVDASRPLLLAAIAVLLVLLVAVAAGVLR